LAAVEHGFVVGVGHKEFTKKIESFGLKGLTLTVSLTAEVF
jgi:hypothetical protein